MRFTRKRTCGHPPPPNGRVHQELLLLATLPDNTNQSSHTFQLQIPFYLLAFSFCRRLTHSAPVPVLHSPFLQESNCNRDICINFCQLDGLSGGLEPRKAADPWSNLKLPRGTSVDHPLHSFLELTSSFVSSKSSVMSFSSPSPTATIGARVGEIFYSTLVSIHFFST